MLATMPLDGWVTLYSICCSIAVIGAFVIRGTRRSQKQKTSCIPLSPVAFAAAIGFGILIGAILAASNAGEPNLSSYFWAPVYYCAVIAVIVALPLLIIVDLPHLLRREARPRDK